MIPEITYQTLQAEMGMGQWLYRFVMDIRKVKIASKGFDFFQWLGVDVFDCLNSQHFAMTLILVKVGTSLLKTAKSIG